MNKKIQIILGTRPEIIKLSPIIRELEARHIDFSVIHTGQHYDFSMDAEFFKDLELTAPKFRLNCGGLDYRHLMAKIVKDSRIILAKEKPDCVLVQGDTNSVLAGALSAYGLGIKVGHLEAGLRSGDLKMAEEVNRIITDQISDYLFAPTIKTSKNLISEGIEQERIYITGNTIVDALFNNSELAKKKSDILRQLNLTSNQYILVTIHRAENVDSPEVLKSIFEGLDLASKTLGLPMIFPVHPRTRNSMNKYNIIKSENIRLIDPVGYLDFIFLEMNSKLIVTDSGGIQEEACVLKKPCVTIRDNTERPETIDVGGNIIAGTKPQKIFEACKLMLNKKIDWVNPFGDGHSASQIIDILLN